MTLTGFGGVGKSRIALEVAKRRRSAYSEGPYVVECADLSDTETVVTAIATRLGIACDPLVPLDSLVDQLVPRTLFIVLETCEAASAPVGGVADAITRACPNVTILATSRRRLFLSSEFVHHVEPLGSHRNPPGDGDAADLSRALAERDGVVPTADAPPHDGLPLLIALAATNARGGSHARMPMPERHITPDANLDWSHRYLDEPVRTLFRRLSIFAGDFELDAVAAVCASDDVAFALSALSELVDASLVNAHESDGSVRYSLFATTRAYAERKLEAAGESAMVAERLARWSGNPHTSHPRKGDGT